MPLLLLRWFVFMCESVYAVYCVQRCAFLVSSISYTVFISASKWIPSVYPHAARRFRALNRLPVFRLTD